MQGGPLEQQHHLPKKRVRGLPAKEGALPGGVARDLG